MRVVLWSCAVFTAITSRSAICFAENPSATRPRTSRWRGLSAGGTRRQDAKTPLAMQELTNTLPLKTSRIASKSSGVREDLRRNQGAHGKRAANKLRLRIHADENHFTRWDGFAEGSCDFHSRQAGHADVDQSDVRASLGGDG